MDWSLVLRCVRRLSRISISKLWLWLELNWGRVIHVRSVLLSRWIHSKQLSLKWGRVGIVLVLKGWRVITGQRHSPSMMKAMMFLLIWFRFSSCLSIC